MNIVLCAVDSELGDAMRRVVSEVDHVFFTAPTASAAIRFFGVERPFIVLVGGHASQPVADACRQLRAADLHHVAVIVAVVSRGSDGAGGLIEAGADDIFVESLGDGELRTRLVVAHCTAAGKAVRREQDKGRETFSRLSHELFCVAGFDGFFKFLGPGWTKTLGWSSAELRSRPYLEFVHPSDRPLTIPTDLSDRGPPVRRFTNRVRRKDGSYRTLEWQSESIPESELVYSVVSDVTEATQTTAVMRELSESLATTLDSIGDGVIATDPAGAVIRMNPVAEQLTGWTLTEAKGQPMSGVLSLVNGESRATVENPGARALREGVTVKLPPHTLLVRRDGTEIPIADSCATIRTGAGAAAGAVLVFRDLSAQCEAEATRLQLEKQLIFGDRMASVGTLAAGVAHEVNNPLSYISMNVELALEEVISISGGSPSGRMKELEAMLRDARQGVERVTRIVRGLKTFSRVDEERPSVIDLLPVIELSINMAANEIRPVARLVKNIDRLPLVEADGARLSQVFINLLVNAAHAVREGHADQNEIRLATSTDSCGRAVVDVSDNGPGVPAALLDRIFDPFFTTKAVGVGTGLGLAVSRSIVTAAGGDISVRSEPGRGTTFRVVLPPSGRTESTSPPGAPVESAPARRAAVLVVDDEPALGAAIRLVLKQHHVTVVTSARDALALLADGQAFDVVLSDLMMPGMSGMDLFAEIGRRHPSLAPRVAFLTGGAFTREAKAFLDGVDNERMDKPFESGALRAMVQRVADRQPLPRSAVAPSSPSFAALRASIPS